MNAQILSTHYRIISYHIRLGHSSSDSAVFAAGAGGGFAASFLALDKPHERWV